MLKLRLSSDVPLTDALFASRLRGALIVPPNPDGRHENSFADCDAVVFFGQQRPRESEMEELLGAGRHVLLAAAPHWPIDRLDALLCSAKRAGRQLSVVNPERFLPSRQLIRQQIPDRIGNAALVRSHRWVPLTSHESSASCHGIPDAVIRDLDVALWLAGRPPTCLFALAVGTNGAVPDGPGFMQIHLGFDEGMALLDYCDRLPAGDGYGSLSVIGTSGAAHADDHQNGQLLYRGGAPRSLKTEESARQYASLVQDFVDALSARQDVLNDLTASTWRRVLSVVEAIRQSLATHQAVALEGR